MKYTTSFFLCVIYLIISLVGCNTSTSSYANPEWIKDLIIKFESEPVGNPPQSIWRYEYQRQKVYYVPPQCCDQFSTLYDENGGFICAPDGGISGRGDGRCSDFFHERKNEKLIWKDHRQP